MRVPVLPIALCAHRYSERGRVLSDGSAARPRGGRSRTPGRFPAPSRNSRPGAEAVALGDVASRNVCLCPVAMGQRGGPGRRRPVAGCRGNDMRRRQRADDDRREADSREPAGEHLVGQQRHGQLGVAVTRLDAADVTRGSVFTFRRQLPAAAPLRSAHWQRSQGSKRLEVHCRAVATRARVARSSKAVPVTLIRTRLMSASPFLPDAVLAPDAVGRAGRAMTDEERGRERAVVGSARMVGGTDWTPSDEGARMAGVR